MAGFLSLYRGTQRVVIPTDDGQEWWVEVKESIPQGDFQAAQALLFRNSAVDAKGPRAQTDMLGFQLELTSRALVNWNLTDEQGTILPFGTLVEKQASLLSLPAPVYKLIAEKVATLNGSRSKDETNSFRAGSEAGHTGEANDQPDPAEGVDA